MSQSLFSTVSLTEVDSSGYTSDEKDVKSIISFTQKFCGQVSIISNNTYISLAFGSITTAVAVRVATDTALSLKLNGGSTVIPMSSYLAFGGGITQVQLLNNSGTIATVDYEIYG